MKLIVSAKANKALDNAENPNETLDYSFEKQREQLMKVKQGLVTLVAAKKGLQANAAQLERQAQTLSDQARTAVANNRPDLARVVLERKQLIAGQLDGMQTQIADLEGQQTRMIENEKRLQAAIEAFRTRKEVIKAQYTAAQATVKIGEAQAGISEEMASIGMAIDRAQTKTQDLQARAAAVAELSDSGALDNVLAPGQSDLDRQIAQLSSSSSVDAELAALQAQLAPPPSPGELPAAGQTTQGQ